MGPTNASQPQSGAWGGGVNVSWDVLANREVKQNPVEVPKTIALVGMEENPNNYLTFQTQSSRDRFVSDTRTADVAQIRNVGKFP